MIPWSDNKIVNESFSVIMNSDADEYDGYLDKYNDDENPLKILTEWVETNNVNNVRFHLSSSEIDSLCCEDDMGETWVDDLREYTQSEFVLHDCTIKQFCENENITWTNGYYNEDYDEELRYNDKYFLNGSDSIMFALIEKVD